MNKVFIITGNNPTTFWIVGAFKTHENAKSKILKLNENANFLHAKLHSIFAPIITKSISDINELISDFIVDQETGIFNKRWTGVFTLNKTDFQRYITFNIINNNLNVEYDKKIKFTNGRVNYKILPVNIEDASWIF